jgi:hypothetical protein
MHVAPRIGLCIQHCTLWWPRGQSSEHDYSLFLVIACKENMSKGFWLWQATLRIAVSIVLRPKEHRFGNSAASSSEGGKRHSFWTVFFMIPDDGQSPKPSGPENMERLIFPVVRLDSLLTANVRGSV